MDEHSPFRPFRQTTFALMWSAMFVAHIGLWIYTMASSWLMVSVSSNTLMIAMVHSATTLPFFCFGLVAGVLVDVCNRRTVFLVASSFIACLSCVFAGLVWGNRVSAPMILIFTFLFGTGMAFMVSAWQAVVPSLVCKEDLPQAVALGGMSVNLSRAFGPALAGLLIGWHGFAAPFLVHALSFVLIVSVVWQWRGGGVVVDPARPPERIPSALKLGLQHAFFSQPLKISMLHTVGFMIFANAFWGLLPALVKNQYAGNAAFFGLIMGSVGFGAVSGVVVLPKLKARFHANELMALGTTLTSLVMLGFAFFNHQAAALMMGLVFGVGWVLTLTQINLSAQLSLPDWVRARGLAVFMMAYFGSASLGSACWGWIAEITTLSYAMMLAAAGGMAFMVLTFRWKLLQGHELDHRPVYESLEPVVHDVVIYEAGPVIVQIAYLVDEADRAEFLKRASGLKAVRKRYGASRWGLYEDTARAGRFIEHFFEASWADHLRHRERASHADKALIDAVLVLHAGDVLPATEHFVAVPEINK